MTAFPALSEKAGHCVSCQLCRDTRETLCDCSHKSQVDPGIDTDIYLIPGLWLFELAEAVGVNL